jgi:hypothetical protein
MGQYIGVRGDGLGIWRLNGCLLSIFLTVLHLTNLNFSFLNGVPCMPDDSIAKDQLLSRLTIISIRRLLKALSPCPPNATVRREPFNSGSK